MEAGGGVNDGMGWRMWWRDGEYGMSGKWVCCMSKDIELYVSSWKGTNGYLSALGWFENSIFVCGMAGEEILIGVLMGWGMWCWDEGLSSDDVR